MQDIEVCVRCHLPNTLAQCVLAYLDECKFYAEANKARMCMEIKTYSRPGLKTRLSMIKRRVFDKSMSLALFSKRGSLWANETCEMLERATGHQHNGMLEAFNQAEREAAVRYASGHRCLVCGTWLRDREMFECHLADEYHTSLGRICDETYSSLIER
jgi:hypothetical protein